MLNNIQNEYRSVKCSYNPTTSNINNEVQKVQRHTGTSVSFRGHIKPVNEDGLNKLFSSVREVLGGIFGSSKKSTITFTPVKQVSKTTTKAISPEEIKYYDEIINEFSEIFPPIKSSNPIWNEKHHTQLHISGDKTIIIRNFDTGEIKYAELQRDDEKLFIDLRQNFLGIQKKQSTEKLTNEFETFLDGRQPSAELFTEFGKHRDIKYIQEEAPNLKEIRHSKIKADEIERLEKLDYSRKEAMYKSLWRSYPTDKFYRIIGKSELGKLLKGETIVSLHPERKRIDITSNPNYNRIFFGEDKFRISFKQKDADGAYHERLTSQIAPCKPEYFHYTIHEYDINDIDINDIHMWNGVEWVKIKLN